MGEQSKGYSTKNAVRGIPQRKIRLRLRAKKPKRGKKKRKIHNHIVFLGIVGVRKVF